MIPRPKAYHWWRKGVLDGADCLRKRRPHLFQEYLELAMVSLDPGEMLGVCVFIYTRAFRVGYDSEREKREKAGIYWKRPKRRVTLE